MRISLETYLSFEYQEAKEWSITNAYNNSEEIPH